VTTFSTNKNSKISQDFLNVHVEVQKNSFDFSVVAHKWQNTAGCILLYNNNNNNNNSNKRICYVMLNGLQRHNVVTSEALGPRSVLVSRGRGESLGKEECV